MGGKQPNKTKQNKTKNKTTRCSVSKIVIFTNQIIEVKESKRETERARDRQTDRQTETRAKTERA